MEVEKGTTIITIYNSVHQNIDLGINVFYADIVGFDEDENEIVKHMVRLLRKYIPPKTTAAICNLIFQYRSPFIAFLESMRQRYNKIYVPLRLVSKYIWYERMAGILKKYVTFKENPLYRKQAKLLDKMAFKKIVLNGEEVPVERVPISGLSLPALRIIVKSVVPLRYTDYTVSETFMVVSLVRAGYLVRITRGGRRYFYAPRQVFMQAVERLRDMWYKFYNNALEILLDLALLQYGRYMYVKYRSITRDDIERLINIYNIYKNLPVKIADEELGEYLKIALDHPEQLTVIEDIDLAEGNNVIEIEV